MSYTNAIFHIDLVNGSDAVRTTLSSCTASNPSGSITRITKVGHGLVTGAVVTLSGFTAWLNGAWKITWVDADNFDLDGAVWQTTADATGDCVPFGGSSWADAWLTIRSGATAARIAPGDVIRISKTPDPVSCGTAAWTKGSGTVTIQALTSCTFTDSGATKVRVTKADHNLVTGNVVVVSATEGGTYDGTYVITYVSSSTFDLDGTTYSADKTGTCTPAFTKTITTCEADWTTVNAKSAAKLAVATDAKQGSYCVKIVEDASPAADQVQAYFATGDLDLSKYQKISFWIKHEVAIAENQLELNLCTGADGTGEVDTFPIPAINTTTKWCVLTIARNGGGNLNSGIKSINISNGSAATTYTASKYVYLDNIIATTTNGLNLQSLISKNGDAQGGTEGFYGIQSIVDNTVILDNYPQTKSNATNNKYGGSTETEKLYIRETFKNITGETLQDTGTRSLYIEYQGGYEVGTTDQNGETYLDGLNNANVGLNLKAYNKINFISLYRYSSGIHSGNWGSFFYGLTIPNLSNNQNGVYLYLGGDNYFENIVNVNNNSNGIALNGASNNVFENIGSLNANYAAIYFASSYTRSGFGNKFLYINNIYYCTYAVNISDAAFNNFFRINDHANAGDLISIMHGDNNYFADTVSDSDTPHYASGVSYNSPGTVFYLNLDKIKGNNIIWTRWCKYSWDTTVYHGTEPGSWKSSISKLDTRGYLDTTLYKSKLKLAEIAVEKDKEVTVTAWVYKDHATKVACRLVTYDDTTLGITEQSDVKTDDTDWEELSISFTPTESGVAIVYLESWNVSLVSLESQSTYVGTISVTQV